MTEEKRIIPLKFDLMFKKVFGNEKDQKPLRKLLECILGIYPKKNNNIKSRNIRYIVSR